VSADLGHPRRRTNGTRYITAYDALVQNHAPAAERQVMTNSIKAMLPTRRLHRPAPRIAYLTIGDGRPTRLSLDHRRRRRRVRARRLKQPTARRATREGHYRNHSSTARAATVPQLLPVSIDAALWARGRPVLSQEDRAEGVRVAHSRRGVHNRTDSTTVAGPTNSPPPHHDARRPPADRRARLRSSTTTPTDSAFRGLLERDDYFWAGP